MTLKRSEYTALLYSAPSHNNHPVGTLKVWTPPSSEPPAQMVIEPIGTKGGEGGGKIIPLMLDTANPAMLPLDASMPLVEIKLVDKEPKDAFDVTIKEPAVRLDVRRVFILPVIELNCMHPIVLAVIMPLDTKDVDMVLRVAN